MKNRLKYSLAALALMVAASAGAQNLMIEGVAFSVKCDAATGTCEIVDNQYKPDEHRYPMHDQSRNFSFDSKANPEHVVSIPPTHSYYGRMYTITKIGSGAFADFQNVKTIYIPSTVTEIDEYAFFRCSATAIHVPASVKKIGNRAFGMCRNLRDLTLPSSPDYMGEKLYTESKKVTISYSEEDFGFLAQNQGEHPAAQAVPQSGYVVPSDKKAQAHRTSSDIDADVPFNEGGTNNNRTYALIFANENYQNEAKVDFAINDGNSFLKYCQNTLGIPKDNIHMRVDATLGQIITELDWLTMIDSEEANILIYYAGHGIPDDKTGNTYLLPVDGNGRNIRTGYELAGLYGQLNDLKSHKVIVFLDACFSGAKRDDKMMSSARGGLKVKSNPQDPVGKVIVFSATQDDQTAHSYDEQQHGMFTYYLLKKLKETKGYVSLGDLADYINLNVVEQSKKMNAKLQTPTVNAGKQIGPYWRELHLK